MKLSRIIALLTATVVLLVLLFLWIPVAPSFPTQPQPTQNYADAIARFEQMHARDNDALFPECHSQLYTHGEAVTRTIVFIHGIANCPAQFATLGQQFYDLGYNVLIPRLPHHGWSDRMTTDIANLTAEELVAAADESLDIAVGLGDEVTLAGFSTGGALAGWVANERADVTQVVLLSAFFSPKAYPAWVIRPLSRVLLLLPNQFWWWDDRFKEELPGPRYAYARYPSHAMAQIMRLGFAVRSQAQRTPPQSARIVVITNAGPRESVDNTVTAQLLDDWRLQGMGNLTTFEFASDLDIDHDYVSIEAPNQPVSVVDVIYPILIEQIQKTGNQNQ